MMWQENSPCLPLPGLTGPTHLCSSTGTPITCLSQKRATWVPWQMGCLATSHVEGSANWRSVNFCIQSRVVYPKGLNGCLVLVIITLPESLSDGMTMLDDEPTCLQVDISQFTTDGHESKTPFLGGGSTSICPTCPAMAPTPKAESQVSMTMEVSELLSWVALDTSGQALGCSTPKRPVSLALGAPPPLMLESSVKPVDTSSQVSLQASIPDNAELDNLTLEEISLPVKTSGLGALASSLGM